MLMRTYTAATPLMTEESFAGRGGTRLHMRSWRPEVPRATVVICHGVNSHSGQYLWTGGKLAEAGFAVYAYDHRGRGRSEGPRFYIDDISDYTNDLGTFIGLAKQREPGRPLFLLGHSAGGVTSCSWALDHQREIDGFICESFAFQVPAPGAVLGLVRWIARLAPRLPVLKLKMRDFTRDAVALSALEADPLTLGEVQPARTVAALLAANDRMRREFSTITLPLLILHGTADRATVPAGSELFHRMAGSPDKTLRLYEDHYHDLLNDLGKEEVLADVIRWIDARL
jgi:alpha-beta hydrolase superfamily lysophospholipase